MFTSLGSLRYSSRRYSSRQGNQHVESRINASSALDSSQGVHIDLTLAIGSLR